MQTGTGKYRYWPSTLLGVWAGLTANTMFRNNGEVLGWLPNVFITLSAITIFCLIENMIRKLFVSKK